jgi:hypothetical protein
MSKYSFLIALLFAFDFCDAQTTSADLAKITTLTQAESYLEKNPDAGKIFYIDSGRDTSEIHRPLYKVKNGFSFSIDKVKYKILQIDSALSFRASYIYLGTDQYSKKQVDSLYEVIKSKYKNGTGFIELVQEYSMDGNVTGDTGWFTENMMVKEFETAIRNQKKGEVFLVETPGMNWHHIVLKTHDNTHVRKLTILMTTK